MEYKTVYGLAGTVDQEINILAENGWVVQSMTFGGLSTETDGQEVFETPYIIYLMARTRQNVSPASAPERRFIGKKM